MRTVTMAGCIGLIAALLTAACGDSSRSLNPTSPSAVVAVAQSVEASAAGSPVSTPSSVKVEVEGTIASGTPLEASEMKLRTAGASGDYGEDDDDEGEDDYGEDDDEEDDEDDEDDEEDKPDAPEVEIRGTLSLLSGTCPALSFMAGTTKVATAATTRFKDGTCAAIKNGDKVEVEGIRQTDGTILATTVKAEKAEAPVSEVKGTLSLLNGACPAISFMAGTTKVATAATTRFKDGTCAAIRNGDKVEVEGVRQTDGTILATTVKAERAERAETPVSEVKGTLSLLNGACPAISFMAGTTKVKTGPATKFKGGACAAIKNGNRVEVKGTPQMDGILLAAVVEVDR